MTAELRRLVEHAAWANRRLAERLLVSRDPEGEGRRLLAHVVGSERIWLLRARGEPWAGLAIWPDLDADESARLAEENRRGWLRLLDAAEPGDVAVYHNSAGTEFRTSVFDLALHVFTHGAYHRGQVNTRLRIGGDEPVNVDLITWTREEP